jgi:hypothetical protein
MGSRRMGSVMTSPMKTRTNSREFGRGRLEDEAVSIGRNEFDC